MTTENPYQPPEARIDQPPPLPDSPDDQVLAGRGARLGAAIIDTIILLVILMPLLFVGGYFTYVMEAAQRGEDVGLGYALLSAVAGFVVFVLVQGWPLHTSGQTWGKRLLQIKIVDLEGRKPSLGRLLGARYFPMQAVGSIPLIGGVLGLVNVLFIFRNDRRCVHDLIAGTRVVMAY